MKNIKKALNDLPKKQKTILVQARVGVKDVDLLKKNNVDIPEFIRNCFKLAAEELK